ncbi:hypothetical protein HOL21_02535 [Candidatus Woesearchaeota archaeon]|nr:hypothetical protein [Candidatus Woesearchaeota archaeon]MBT5397068.1 hypothetical protein [Candidatus Woesearchaeota archaeon]MBT6367386.1 hypothetical protein [Candidatus Woesearchaeota archaeon]MBT7762468.1 hypothetical protein [Candidatus Woesearchaeota archaeon]
MSDDKKKKDPWHKDNIDKTIKSRQNDQRNLLNVIQAMDSQLQHEVTNILKAKAGEGIPDWSLLDRESSKYDKKVADSVRAKIDEVYSIDSKLHPLAGVIKKAGLDNNYFNKKLIEGIYFKHTDALKKNVGAKDYMAVMKSVHKNNLDKVEEQSLEHLLSDVDSEKHGDGVVDYIHGKHKFDKSKVNSDLMKYNPQGLLRSHMGGDLNKDTIHRQYRAGKKKK